MSNRPNHPQQGRDVNGRPYTPERLAERWECSPQHIRAMLADGRVNGFKLGGKLWRISAAEVERVECRTTDLDASRENSAQSGKTKEDATDTVSEKAIQSVQGQLLSDSADNVSYLPPIRTP